MNFVDFNRHVIASPDSSWPDGKPRSLTHRLVLFVVCTGAPRTPTDIARLTGLRKTSVAAAIDELERQQMVRRERSMHDRRNVHVRAYGWVLEMISEAAA